MAIDTSGGSQGDTPANEATPTAGDLAQLSDDKLFEELGLAELSQKEAPASGAQDARLENFDAPQGGEPEGEGETDAEAEGESGEAGSADAGQDAAAAETDTAESGGDAGEGGARALAAEFTLRQGDAEVEIPTDVSISFIADGEQRDLPLDRVVRLAQMGYYNEQRAAEIKEFREALPEIEERFEALQNERDMLLQGWQRALAGDDEYLEQERESYLRATSPEARAQRLERELEEVRRGQSTGRADEVGRQFVQSIAPEFEAISKESPEVSFEEVIGKFNMLTAPLMVRGQIPPSKFREVASIVRGELRQWADAQNTKRAGTKKTQTQSVERAQSQATAAKRQAARAVLPRGTQTGGAQKQAPKTYDSASDVLDDVANIVRGDNSR